MHVAEHPDTSAQAQRLATVLKGAGVPVRVYGARESTHNKINADLGVPDDPGTRVLFRIRRRGAEEVIARPWGITRLIPTESPARPLATTRPVAYLDHRYSYRHREPNRPSPLAAAPGAWVGNPSFRGVVA
jgi:hypothetical protein